MKVITLLVDRDASLDAVNDYQKNYLHFAAFYDRLDVCLYLIDVKGFDPAVLSSLGGSALSHFGCFVGDQQSIAHGDDRPALTPAVIQARVALLIAARETYLQRIRDENWAKNKAFIQFLVGCGFRPMAVRAAELAMLQLSLDKAAPIDAEKRDTPELNRLYLQRSVLMHEGVVRLVASYL